MKYSILKITTSSSLLLMGVALGLAGNYLIDSPQLVARTNNDSLTSQQNINSNLPTLNPNASNVNFVSQVVQEVGPAVVKINASRAVASSNAPVFNDPFFRQFFGNQIPPNFQPPNEEVRQGTGSGFILSDDGKILTNAHVVEGATDVTVSLKDGRVLPGKVLGKDSLTDLAVIKIEADNLPTVVLGDSDQLIIGEWAIAIGNPLGLDNTVTTGIISATGRSSSEIGVGDKRIDFLQTDAAINPGNSGGPLLNAKGEVIGINTAIIKNAQGLGFAIPINKAQAIAETLIANGKVEHSYLGISMVALNPQIKQELKQNKGLNITEDQGVLIMQVAPNSPAEKAGLKSGDIITKINDQLITDAATVQKIVEKTNIDDSLQLQLTRDQKSINIEVKVGILPTS